MDHVIHVSLVEVGEVGSGQAVNAEPNPLPDLQPGDTVIWLLDQESVGEKPLRVKFQEIRSEPADGTEPRPCGPSGPLGGFSFSRAIVGTVGTPEAGRRFIYKFFNGENDMQIEWNNHLPGDENFGGLDVPPPPPRPG